MIYFNLLYKVIIVLEKHHSIELILGFINVYFFII
jgi:hypothetical protein